MKEITLSYNKWRQLIKDPTLKLQDDYKCYEYWHHDGSLEEALNLVFLDERLYTMFLIRYGERL